MTAQGRVAIEVITTGAAASARQSAGDRFLTAKALDDPGLFGEGFGMCP